MEKIPPLPLSHLGDFLFFGGVRNGIMLMAQAKKRGGFFPLMWETEGCGGKGKKSKKGGRGKKTTTISRILPFFFRFLPRVFLLSSPSAPHLSKVLFCVFSQCLFFCGKRTVSLHFRATKVRYFLHLLSNFFIIIGPSSTQTLGLNPSISFLFPEKKNTISFSTPIARNRDYIYISTISPSSSSSSDPGGGGLESFKSLKGPLS